MNQGTGHVDDAAQGVECLPSPLAVVKKLLYAAITHRWLRHTLLWVNGRSMIQFRFFGVPVHIHPFFWITLALLGGALGANSADAIMRTSLFVLAGFVSILVHEQGHALIARKFGAWSEITLHAFGGYAQYSGRSMTRRQSFLITAAGPVFQIGLGVLVNLLLTRPLPISPYLMLFLYFVGQISIFWAVVNLLPVFPLDGGQMLHAMLGPARLRATLWISILTAVTAAIYVYLSGGGFFAFFLALFAWKAWKALQENRLP